MNMNMETAWGGEPPPFHCETCGVGGDIQHVALCDICSAPRCAAHRVACDVCCAAAFMTPLDWGVFFCNDASACASTCHRVHMASKHGEPYDGFPPGLEGLPCEFEWMLTQKCTANILLCMWPGEVRALKVASYTFNLWVEFAWADRTAPAEPALQAVIGAPEDDRTAPAEPGAPEDDSDDSDDGMPALEDGSLASTASTTSGGSGDDAAAASAGGSAAPSAADDDDDACESLEAGKL